MIEGSLGSAPGAVLLHTSTLRATVDLGSPASSVKALLRGFAIGHSSGDHNYKHLAVDLETGYGDDASHVVVTARIRLSDKSPTTEPFSIGPELIEARVDYLLLVE